MCWSAVCDCGVSSSYSFAFSRLFYLLRTEIMNSIRSPIFNFNKNVTNMNIDSNTGDSLACQHSTYSS